MVAFAVLLELGSLAESRLAKLAAGITHAEAYSWPDVLTLQPLFATML